MQIQRVAHIATASLNSLFELEEHARGVSVGFLTAQLCMAMTRTCCLAVSGSGVFRPDSRSKPAARVTSVHSAGTATCRPGVPTTLIIR
jgi:hypothetical protein